MNNYLWIWKFIRHKKWAFLAGFFFMALEIASNVAETGLQKWVIDNVFIQQHFDELPVLLVLLGLSYILSSSLFTVVAMIYHTIGYHLRLELAEKLMSSIQRIPIKVLQSERTAKYVSVFDDVYATGENAYRIPMGLQDIFRALTLITIIASIHPLILVILVVVSCSYTMLGRYFSSRVKNISKEVIGRRTDLLVHIEEGISSTREVIAYHRMNWEKRIYDTLFKKYYDKIVEESKLTNLQMFITGPLQWSSNLIVLVYGGYLVISGILSVGTFIILYQYASQLTGAIQNVFDFTMRLSASTAQIERIRAIMEGEQVADGDKNLPGAVETIEFKDVCFKYSSDANKVLDQFTLYMPLGKKIAIVGTSGGGKSTLSKLLIRFHDPQSGEILINGHRLGDIKMEDWMSRLSIAFQDPYIFPDSIRNNIVFGRKNVSEEYMVDICRRMLIHDFIEDLDNGYDTEIGERGITLSGGQRQRISLARALLTDPEILILDEATSSLDMETERQIQRNLDEIRGGKTTIIIAHRLSTVQNADIIFVIDGGRVVEEGTHDILMSMDTVYKQLVHSQDISDLVYVHLPKTTVVQNEHYGWCR